MSKPVIAQAEALWMQAIAAPLGIGIHVVDLVRAKAQLGNARIRLREKGVDTSAYQIRVSPENPAFELWILRTVPSGPREPDPNE
jgi:hypothetical protein